MEAVKEFSCSPITEFDFELRICWEHVLNWCDFAAQVVGAEDGLIEFFMCKECEWDVKSLPFCFSFGVGVDEDHSIVGDDHVALSFEIGEVLDFDFEFQAASFEDKCFSVDSIGIAIGSKRGIKCHICKSECTIQLNA